MISNSEMLLPLRTLEGRQPGDDLTVYKLESSVDNNNNNMRL